jgi:hypothetical protein
MAGWESNCRLPNVVRSPPARRYRKFSHYWLMFGSSFTRFLYHTQRRTTGYRTPLDEWSARRRDLYLTTQNTHNRQTDIHFPGGIRTHDLRRRAAVDLRLRPRGHWDRLGTESWRFRDCDCDCIFTGWVSTLPVHLLNPLPFFVSTTYSTTNQNKPTSRKNVKQV